MGQNLPVMQETWVQSPCQEDPLEEGMATHSSILAWGTPRTEEPSGLEPMGSQSGTRPSTHTQTQCMYINPKLLICPSPRYFSIH